MTLVRDDAAAVDISVLIPTRAGGALLEELVRALVTQQSRRPFELILVDSGSPPEEIARLRQSGARVETLDPREFDHGRTRDRLAALARGQVLVFLNQDAIPVGSDWLERLTGPLFAAEPPVAVQGAIREFEPEEAARAGLRRFFWDSCGPRFYFTRESVGWIARHGGLGFSTVHCALLRSAWEQLPFGAAAILEDKKWQQAAASRGWRIGVVPDAVVRHTHDYGLRSLLRRCASEGFGWRLVGERYRLRDAVADLVLRAPWKEWRRALRDERLETPAERWFPLLRPLALWWGNRWSRRVLH